MKRSLRSLSPGRSLRARALLSHALALTVVMVVIIPLATKIAGENTQRVLNDRILLTATAARNLDMVVQMVLDDLVTEASAFSFEPLVELTEGQVSRLKTLSRHVSRFSQRISVLDLSGTVRWTTPEDASVVGGSLASRPFIREALGDPQPRVSNLLFSLTGRPVILMVAPLTDRQGRFSGLLSGEVELAETEVVGFIPDSSLGETGYVQVLDSEGNVLVDGNSRGAGQYDTLSHLRGLVSERQPRTGRCYRCHMGPAGPEREAEIMSFYPLSAAPWGVMVRQLEAEAMAGVWQLQRDLLLAGTAILAFSLAAVVAGTRRVFRPLRDLTLAATRIARGDFNVPVAARQKNEVGDLAQSFEQMRVKVRDLLEKERLWRESLEGQVKDATRDLAALYDVSQTINRTSLNLQELLGTVLERVVYAIEPADAGVLFLKTAGGKLAPAASVGYDQAHLQGIVLKPGEGMAGKALRQGPVVCNSREAIRETQSGMSGQTQALLYKAAASLPPVQSALAFPLVHGGQTQGVLVVASHSQEGSFSPQHTNLAASVADLVAVGLTNARLYEQIQQREASSSHLLRKLISAQEEERQRIARELHDEAGQALTAVMMSAARAERALPPEMEEAKTRLQEARARAAQALNDVRRLILDLRPQVLDDLGLVPALRWFVKNQMQESVTENRLEITGIEGRLPSQVEVTVFRVIQEALTNVSRHSEASRAIVRLSLKDSQLRGIVKDNGRGFDVGKVLAVQSEEEGWGLRGMEERVSLLGGSLSIQSQPGRGTNIQFRIPLATFEKEMRRGAPDEKANN